MFKEIWNLFIKYVWPLIRETFTEVTREIMKWIKESLSDLLHKRAQKQQDEAEKAADSARKRAESSNNHDDRIRAEAETEAWKNISEKLKKDNEELKNELDRLMQSAMKHAEERIDYENVKRSTKAKVLTLAPPDVE